MINFIVSSLFLYANAPSALTCAEEQQNAHQLGDSFVFRTSLSVLVIVCSLLSPICAQSPSSESEKAFNAKELLEQLQQWQNRLSDLPKKEGEAVISLEQLRLIQSKIAALQKQLEQTHAPVPVTSCLLDVKTQDGSARIDVKLELNLLQEHGSVVLGFTQAQPVQVLVDKQLPTLMRGSKGLTVLLDGKGQHEITAQFDCPISELSQSRLSPQELREGIELSLPPAAYVLVQSLSVPDGASSVQVNDKVIALPLKKALSLAKLDSLKINWKKQISTSQSQSIRQAQGTIDVYLDPSHVTTQSVLKLQSQGKPVKDWRLQVPNGALVKVLNDPDMSIQTKRSGAGQFILERKTPSSGTVTVEITSRQSRKKNLPALGPFTVLDATVQSGVIRFHGQSNQWVSCKSVPAGKSFHVSLVQRNPTEAEKSAQRDLISLFSYKAQGLASDFSLARDAWVQPELHTVQGRASAKLTHHLQMIPGPENKPVWRLLTRLDVTPIQQAIEQITLSFPSPWVLDQELGPKPAELVRVVNPETTPGRIRLELAQPTLDSFTIWIEASYREDKPITKAGQQMILAMPRPLGMRSETKHELHIEVPMDYTVRVESTDNPELQMRSREPHELRWESRRFPEQIRFACEPYQPEQQVDSLIDIYRQGKTFQFKHRLKWNVNQTPPQVVTVLVPKTLAQSILVTEGIPLGMSEPEKNANALIALRVTPVVSRTKKAVVTLDYRQSLDASANEADTLRLLQVHPAGATYGKCKARVWSESGGAIVLQGLSQKLWEPLPLEQAPEQSMLPIWVGQANQPDAELHIHWQSMDRVMPESHVQVERALFQVRVNATGSQQHQMRFLLHSWATPELDVEFPSAISPMRLKIYLNDLEIVGWQRLEGASTIRLPLIPYPGGTHVLKFIYTVESEGSGSTFSFVKELHSPKLSNILAPFETRWQIDLPDMDLPLSWDGSGQKLWTWGIRGWLFGPLTSESNADLERWFQPIGESPDQGTSYPSLIIRLSSQESLTIVTVPEQAWTLFCSLLIVTLGLAFYIRPRRWTRSGQPLPSRWFWPMTGLCCSLIVVVGILWPGPLAAMIYGCQPGAAVLFLLLFALQFRRRQSQRRLMVLPGFRQGQSEEEMLTYVGGERGSGSQPKRDTGRQVGQSPSSQGNGRGQNPKRQTSTVDAPPLNPLSEELQ